MTPESQRIAIAEACGWSIHQITVQGMKDVAILPPGVSIKDEGAVWKYASITLPDYLNDLNAMHEAEKVLSDFQLRKYGNNLQEIMHWYCVGVIEDYPRHLVSLARISMATAAQRAEAFLRTLGLWDDTK